MPKGFGNNTQSCAFATLNTFLTLQIILGIATIAFNEYFKYTLSKYVGKAEADEIQMQFFFMEIFAIHVIIFYACGFLVVKKFRKEPYTAHLLTLLKIWHVFIFLVSLDGFLTNWVIFRSAVTILSSIEMSLRRGIEVYYSSPEWRIVWDDLQYHQQCCGVESYKDWQNTAWIEYEYDDNMSLAAENPCDTKLLSLTPYSCSKIDSGCYQNNVPQKSADSMIMDLPAMELSNINQEGCLTTIEDSYMYALYAQLLIAVLVFLLQMLILLVMRIIFLRSDFCFPLQKVNCESQTTFVVTCGKNDIPESGYSPVTLFCVNEEEDPCPPKNFGCANKRKVEFDDTEECSPLLIH